MSEALRSLFRLSAGSNLFQEPLKKLGRFDLEFAQDFQKLGYPDVPLTGFDLVHKVPMLAQVLRQLSERQVTIPPQLFKHPDQDFVLRCQC